MSHRLLSLATLTLALCAALAQAQDVRVFGVGEAVDPTDVARILDQSEAEPVIKMRSLKLLDEPAPAAAKRARPARSDEGGGDHEDLAPKDVAYTTSAQAPRPTPASLALPVQFEFDSATILPSATRQLDALAEGIRMLPTGRSVLIEGHTDATGAPQYNEQLSQRRAYAVRNYLVAVQHLDPARLRAVGMGQAGLLPGLDARAPENRRVQFRGE
jgi:outer membrane protein OmpA-like peptidoglycan-associated protein